ncbi:MAG TPA: hypothetical protein VFN97_24905, partial [Actinospica sp.]|nr:hypothetical protein [Actinospica sp.]
MATQHGLHIHLGRRPEAEAAAGTTALAGAGLRDVAIAVIRVGTGFVFLWAFLDKTFGLGYATPS